MTECDKMIISIIIVGAEFMEEITLEYLMNHDFEKSGLEEVQAVKPRVSGRFSEKELSRLPVSDEEKKAELNIEIAELIRERFGNYRNCGQKCNLNPETIRKVINSNDKQKRKISKIMLAKFVVGCGLSLNDANKLFELHSSKLNAETTQLDAVVIHCIEKHLDIDGFFDTCDQIGLDISYSE